MGDGFGVGVVCRCILEGRRSGNAVLFDARAPHGHLCSTLVRSPAFPILDHPEPRGGRVGKGRRQLRFRRCRGFLGLGQFLELCRVEAGFGV